MNNLKRLHSPIIIYILFSASMALTCKQPDKGESNAMIKDTLQTDSVAQPIAEEKEILQEPVSDTLINEPPVYEDTAKILRAGQFHEGEAWLEAEEEEWYGLFHRETHYYLEKTTIETTQVKDELLDMGDEMSGLLVSNKNPDEPLIFIEALSFLKNASIEALTDLHKVIFPGDTIRFTYHGTHYELHATGIENPDERERQWDPVRDYKLFLTANEEGKTTTQLLVAHENFDQQMVDIIFAGDIDGDNVPDLIIDTARHYNVSSPTLYLSKPAEKGSILKPVGVHRTVGC